MERRLMRLPLFLLLAVGSASCMPDLKSDLPPDRIYWLEVPELQDPPAVDLQLSVVPGLDSDRIWLLQRDQRLNYYAGAYWPDNLRPLLESLLARSLLSDRSAADVQVLIERFEQTEPEPGGPIQKAESQQVRIDEIDKTPGRYVSRHALERCTPHQRLG